eukprot:GFYU01009402.1.p1 GENE.GFYU01009402.1~~GFYU01009402.1.p1  ORF type:complete len:344 (-),score=97.18 GFYU01009402.1:316-1347(-)
MSLAPPTPDNNRLSTPRTEDGMSVSDTSFASPHRNSGTWMNDDESNVCLVCSEKFTVRKRRHHCRHCGKLVCGTCAPKRTMPSLGFEGPTRLCDSCVTQKTTEDKIRSFSVIIDEKDAKLAEMQDELASREDALDGLRKGLLDNQNTSALRQQEAEREKNSMVNEKKRMQASLDDMQNKISIKDAEIDDLNTRMSLLESNLESARGESSNWQTMLQQEKESAEATVKKMNELHDAKTKKLKHRLSELETAAKTKDQEIQAANATKEVFAEELNGVRRDLAAEKVEKEKMIEQIRDLKAQLAQAEDSLRSGRGGGGGGEGLNQPLLDGTGRKKEDETGCACVVM